MFAHGPWYTEWHHIAGLIVALPVVGVWAAWVMHKVRRRKDDE